MLPCLLLGAAAGFSIPGLRSSRARVGRAHPAVCREDEHVVIIGSGIGGLSCACMLARYGRRVTVVESHEHAGGCAHSFERKTKAGTFVFDSGPSLWSGMSAPSVNPLRQVLDLVGESDSVEWCGRCPGPALLALPPGAARDCAQQLSDCLGQRRVEYDGWGMVLPEGDFYFKTGDAAAWAQTLREFGGADAEAQWLRLREVCDPVTAAAGATPPMVLRSDAWVALPVLRCLGGIMQAAPHAAKLNGPFSLVMEQAARPLPSPPPPPPSFRSAASRPPPPTMRSQSVHPVGHLRQWLRGASVGGACTLAE